MKTTSGKLIEHARLLSKRTRYLCTAVNHQSSLLLAKMAAGSLFSKASRRFALFSCAHKRSIFTQTGGDDLSHVFHKPVMLKEVLGFLSPRNGQVNKIVLISLARKIFLFVVTLFLSSCKSQRNNFKAVQ